MVPSWILHVATIVGGIAAIIGLWERFGKRRRRGHLDHPWVRTRPKPARWKRWTVATALALPVPVLVFLAITRATSTDVSLVLSLSGVSFELSKEVPLLSEPLRLAELGASGLEGIETPMEWVDAAGNPIGVLEASALFLSAAQAPSTSAVYLDDVVLPIETAVTIQTTDYPGEFRASFTQARVEPSVSVDGTIEVVAPAVLEATREFEPGKFRLIPSTDWITLDLVLLNDSAGSFSPNLQAGDLELYRVDRYRQGTAPKDRMVSTVLSGEIYFPHLDRRLRLEDGDELWFAGSSGEVDLTLSGNEIDLRFDGAVSGLRTGTPELSRSIMPRRGEVWLARYALVTVPVALLYLIALYATVRWWRGWA